MTLLLLVL